jgi:hypothetical protein
MKHIDTVSRVPMAQDPEMLLIRRPGLFIGPLRLFLAPLVFLFGAPAPKGYT